jgi:hypothetical protein
MSTPSLSIERPLRPENPEALWREICWVTPQLAVSGDLSSRKERARAQLLVWEEAGITDVFDMRGEADDSEFIHSNSTITSHWFGVDDNGGTRSDAWFEAFTTVVDTILADPERRILVHCHMGVNRGPSAAFTALITHGVDPIQALTQIRSARPVAAILYSFDAVQWFARRQGKTEQEVADLFQAVYDWHVENPLDLVYCIQQIGNRYAA